MPILFIKACTNCFVVICASWTFEMSLFAQSFSAEGKMVCRSFQSDIVLTQIQSQVRILVSTNRWLIVEMTVANHDVPEQIETNIFAFDSQYYYIGHKGIESGQMFIKKKESQFSTSWWQYFSPYSGIPLTWFALVPNIFSNAVTHGSGPCVWNEPIACRHNIKFSLDGGNETGRSCVWRNQGTLYGEGEASRLVVHDWPQPFREGFTNAIYESQISDVAGYMLPKYFRLNSYWPDFPSADASNRLLIQDQWTWSAESLSVSRKTEELDSWFLLLNDFLKEPVHSHAAAAEKSDQSIVSGRHLKHLAHIQNQILWVILIVGSFPLCWVLRRKMTCQKTQRTSKID